jgi:hypothetical protein
MPTIAISYRRSDSSAISGRIYDRLAGHYGEQSIFMDIDNIPFGIDFRIHIQETLQRTDILIAVIGANWLGSNADGSSRMLEKNDPVRAEIETALERKLPILPVLVDGAKMPDNSELPIEFGNFAYLNAAEVMTGRDFRSHMDRLVGAIDRLAEGNAAAATPLLTSGRGQPAPSARQALLNDLLRYLVLPLVLLLVVHHIVVNAYDLNTLYLQIACVGIPLLFSAALSRLSSRGAIAAIAFAITLGVIGDSTMTISQSLYSGDPVMPQTRFEWWDNIDFAAIIALSYLAGYIGERALCKVLGSKFTQA